MTKFAHTVLFLVIIYTILLVFYSFYKIYYQFNSDFNNQIFFYILSAFIGLLLTVFFLYSFKFQLNKKLNIATLVLVIGFTMFSFETYFELSNKSAQKWFFLNKLNKINKIAYPNISPSMFIKNNGFNLNNNNIFPLGGISKVISVVCDENGYISTYQADKYGFNNANSFHENNNIDVILLGDSFIEGHCVKADESIGYILNRNNLKSLSFGKGGNSGLIELGTLIEYIKPLKPKVVIWTFVDNDFEGLKNELTSNILKSYLNNNFTQNLNNKQDKIDEILINYYDNQKINHNVYFRIFRFANIREKIKLTSYSIVDTNGQSEISYDKELIIFKEILQKTKKIVSKWNGKLYFMYLPSYQNVSKKYKYVLSQKIINFVNEMNIPIIDIYDEVFLVHSDPLSLFPFKEKNHYNSKGYELVSKTIIKKINNNKLIK